MVKHIRTTTQKSETYAVDRADVLGENASGEYIVNLTYNGKTDGLIHNSTTFEGEEVDEQEKEAIFDIITIEKLTNK
jgi:hypothetical protein